MMAWHGTASPTKWETQSAGSGPSSQISHLQRAHRPQSPSSPPGPVRGEKGQLQGSVAQVGLPTSLQAMPGTLCSIWSVQVTSEGPWTGRGLAGGVR